MLVFGIFPIDFLLQGHQTPGCQGQLAWFQSRHGFKWWILEWEFPLKVDISPWKWWALTAFLLERYLFFFLFCPKIHQVVSWSVSLAGYCITPLRCLSSLKNLQAIPGGFDNLNIPCTGKWEIRGNPFCGDIPGSLGILQTSHHLFCCQTLRLSHPSKPKLVPGAVCQVARWEQKVPEWFCVCFGDANSYPTSWDGTEEGKALEEV